MSDRMQECTGLGCGYAGPGNDPANSPTTSMLDPDANRHGRGANSVLSQRPENYPENSQLIEDSPASPGSGPAPSERRADVSSTALTQAAVLRRTPPSNNHERRRSQSHASDVDESSWQSTLPEDDGMGVLRRKIHAIRDMESSSAEKARMVHELMTEKYNASKWHSELLVAPSSPRSPERLSTPISHRDGRLLDHLSSPTAAPKQQNDNPYNLTEEDLKPTFFPRDEPESPVLDGEDMDTEEFEEAAILGCQHYKRNVKLQCVTCKKWYTCRFCHDEVEDHHLIRHKTENMLCMICGHAQPAAHFCEKCGEQAAQYFCESCKLWDNDSKKSIYHCTDCGICRIGQGLGKDFFHCKVRSDCAAGMSYIALNTERKTRHAVCAYLYQLKTPIGVSNGLPNAIVPFAGIICLPRLKLWLSCDVDTVSTTDAFRIIRRALIVAQFVARPSRTWSLRFGI